MYPCNNQPTAPTPPSACNPVYFSGKDAYEFGDVSKELNKRRAVWVKEVLGSEEYAFGDLTKKAFTSFTGKDEYEFGDVTKKVLGGFGKFLGGNKPKGANDRSS
mmetsp:Transcript_78803/g.157514  ORF Transcript_78803/g.157514 Transcript_78803/m.157514 type:complete len:104 (+) Transcript_78803:889-1200(+)